MNDELNCNPENRPEPENGGRTTTRPPLSQHATCMHVGQILTSGVDTITLALELVWKDESFFQILSRLQDEAKIRKAPVPGQLQTPDLSHALMYEVQRYGHEGYRWILNSTEWTIYLGDWLRPMVRPSAMVTFRSETLWLYGPTESIDRLFILLQTVGGHVSKAKASRVDICADILLPEVMWNLDLVKHKLGHIRKTMLYLDFDEFTGMQLSKGPILARLYDKAFEIEACSQKTWMYDIWKIDKVPEKERAIRVEFQLRREILKQLALDTIWDFLHHPRALWAYCTQDWLRFADKPRANKRDRTTLPFWKTIQEGFLGGQCGHPLLRAKMINVKRRQLSQQMLGSFTSLLALKSDTPWPSLRMSDEMDVFHEGAALIKMDDDLLSERVRMKLAKYQRGREKFDLAQAQRAANNLPQWKNENGEVA